MGNWLIFQYLEAREFILYNVNYRYSVTKETTISSVLYPERDYSSLLTKLFNSLQGIVIYLIKQMDRFDCYGNTLRGEIESQLEKHLHLLI